MKKIIGMFGIMLALAVMLVGAPAASANTATAQGKLSVYAIDATSGNAVSQATVAVYDATSPTVGTPVAKGTTSSTGVFVTYLRAGTYRVVVTADGFKSNSQYVTIEKGYNTDIKAALESATVR